MKRIQYLSLGLGLLTIAVATHESFAIGTDLEPGTYRCQSSSATLLRGRCEYRPRPNGSSAQSLLIEKAKRALKPLAKQRTSNNLEPQSGAYGNIEWWFEDENGVADDVANSAMGDFLQANDRGFTIQTLPEVEITTMMYEFDKSQERKLGLEVTSFLGKRTLEQAPGELVQTLTEGLFKAAVGIGNPLSSFLQLGIKATMDSSKHIFRVAETTKCEIGTTCQNGKSQMNHYHVPGLPSTKDEDVGFRISTVPQIDPDQPGLVRLENLTVSYSKFTGEPNAPVVTYSPKTGSGTTIYTDELLVIGSETSESSGSDRKILEVGSSKGSTKFLIMMKVNINMPRGVANPYPKNQMIGDDRSLTPDEIRALPDGELSLEDILRSIEPVCFKNIVTPETQEPVCGFKLMKLDRQYLNHRLRFTIKKGGFLGMGGNELFNENERTRVWKVSDVYDGKGFYALPAFLSEQNSGAYTLTVELDKSNPIAKARRKAERVKGIKFTFGYNQGVNPPLEFDSRQIRVIK
ncbi:MAG: hypothetical protein A2X97_13720 [Bdellovibrionales bacterium GWA1_52_35]|nr:MAG: hypothetical protein A2X97_13720 [Bdellovibrionales bacterium GWA1_52_35]HCM39593.1 hypothetical protein [Bdellovibrionales bacterium]